MTLGDRIVVMKDGNIHQCGTPLEIYTRPTNQFVAGFIGTPPMNFLPGSIEGNGEGTFFACEGLRLRLSPEHALRLGQRTAGPNEVVLGLRPEAMSLESVGRFAGNDNSIALTLGVVEPLGEKMDLFATVGGRQLVARVDASEHLQPGAPISLHVDMKKVHLFEPGGAGKNLGLAEA